MKERYNIEIAGIKFSIVSDDGEQLVRGAEAALEENVKAVLDQNRNISTLDAVTLCALDFCGEFMKAEAKIKNLEAQIEILEANMHRLREESAPAAETAEPVEEISAVDDSEPEEAELTDVTEEAEEIEETSEESGEDDGARDQKFRQLEALLGSQLKFDLDKE